MLCVLKRMISILAVVSVISCGGGGGDNYIVGPNDGNSGNDNSSGGGSDTDTTAEERIADLEIAASSRQLSSDGSNPVTISAVVKDINNNIITDVDVLFAVDNGGTIEPDAGNESTTAADGTVTMGNAVKIARLTPGFSKENRALVVSVTAGDQTRTLDVEVTGTTLSLNGPESVVLNATGTYQVTMADGAGMPMVHQVLSVSSANGNTIAPVSGSGFATDQNGQLTFEVTALNSGVDTITIAGQGASVSRSFSVSGDNFTLNSTRSEIVVNTGETISLIWVRNGVPQANRLIQLAATRGMVPASVVTDSNGHASFVLSSATAGGVVITAVDSQSGLNATLVREFVAVTPTSLTAQSEQTNISPEGHTMVVATVRDVSYNPVKNQKVSFNIVHDTVNGKLSSATAITDSLGRASVIYTAGNASSARDGVQIRASLLNHAHITDTINLSVGDRAVQIVLGHDENMTEDDIYYRKTFGVIVTDNTGSPVAGSMVNFSLTPVGYYKGGMTCDADESPDWQQIVTAYCPSEDLNDNAILDVELGEDYNSNGRLDPTHTATITNRSVMTDAEGRASVEVVYPQSHALWSRMLLSASTSVAGTEYVESLEFGLSISQEDLGECETRSSPNSFSPYGIASQCESPD